MIAAHTLPFPAPTPSIDAGEARWAAGELAGLLRQMDPESPSGQVLRQARRELESLVRSVEGPTVVGPFRVRAAA